MLLPQNGLAAFTRREFHGALFSALLAFALFDSEAASAQEVKQIKLTEKYIQGFIAASKDMASLNDDANPDQPDPKIEAEAVAKRNGFASLAEYEDVAMNISMIMTGIDPQTKKFTEPPEQIRKQIAALKADKSVSEGGKEGRSGGPRDGPQGRKAHSVQGKHCAGAKVLRQASPAAGYE